ncbi:hypothetical protein HOD08_01125 [bacterium]|nr:hypothetical protein [bacterium]
MTIELKSLLLATISCLLLAGCQPRDGYIPAEKEKPEQKTSELDFTVENKTGKTTHVCCFTYLRKETIMPWRWDKSEVYTLKPGESIKVDIDTLKDKIVRENVFGHLGIFDTAQAAENASPYNVSDENKLDLDKLSRINGKAVALTTEVYGVKVSRAKQPYERKNYFLQDGDHAEKMKELDFPIENKTGKTILATVFIYEKPQRQEPYSSWLYSKTPIYKLAPNESVTIDIKTLKDQYDWRYMSGTLAVFDESEEQNATEATYESLGKKAKKFLGRLRNLQKKKIVVEIEKYGNSGDKIEYTVGKISSPLSSSPLSPQ